VLYSITTLLRKCIINQTGQNADISQEEKCEIKLVCDENGLGAKHFQGISTLVITVYREHITSLVSHTVNGFSTQFICLLWQICILYYDSKQLNDNVSVTYY